MSKVVPILIFSGQANEAIKLYEKAFGGKTKMLYYHKGTERKDLVFWSEMEIKGQIIAFGDDPKLMDNDAQTQSSSFLIDILIHFDSDDELRAAYEILADGGTITTPLSKESYCSLTAALIDKFGGRWQLMSGYEGA